MTSPDAEVVPLRAKDAGTETRVTESAGPAYTDLSDGRAQRKPIIPAHWRTWEAAREHVKLAAARHGHAAAYHGVRAPGYLVLTAWWALVGIGRTVAAAAGVVARARTWPSWSGRPPRTGCCRTTCGSTRPGRRPAPPAG